MESRPKKLLDQLRDAIRIKHYSYSTEKTSVLPPHTRILDPLDAYRCPHF
jgi:hypothetical protein